MLSIPPHSSHRLQPLDVTFFGPLKKAYGKECDMYLKSRNLIKISPYEIAELFNRAYTKVACLDIGISGFKTTGIFPINPTVFSDEDFIETEVQNSTISNNLPVIQSQPTATVTSQQTELLIDCYCYLTTNRTSSITTTVDNSKHGLSRGNY